MGQTVTGRLFVFLFVTIIAGFLIVPFLPAAWAIPSGFTDIRLAGGLNSPTAMDFSPDGRLFVTEKGGSLRVIKNGVLLATPFATVSVDTYGERGLLGVAFDPNFSSNSYVYVYYTATTPTIHNRISRFTADPVNPDRALAGSERILLDLVGGSGNGFHNGGAIHFGKDGKLYAAVGNHGDSANSQSLSNHFGKILRINSDGTTPLDNPFYNTTGAQKQIWALGLRNPFTFAFSPSTTGPQMYINDVGENSWEEINPGQAGANYGWPTCEGVCSDPRFVNPVYAYPHAGSGKAIAGGAFYYASQFPSEYKGSYFFGDYVAGFVKRLTSSNQVVDFLSNVSSPVDLKIGPDGSLYYLAIGTGEVHKVQYAAGGNNAPTAVASASPKSGAVPLTVNFSGAGSSDPDSDPLTYSWDFGDGSIVGTGITISHTYDRVGPYTATLTVSDGRGGTSTASVSISVGTPPIATIDTPTMGLKYNAGDTISFSGSGSDAEDGPLPASAFKWTVLLHHNTHTHPFEEFSGVTSGTFVIPTTGETDSDVWYRIYLTVTDSSGLSTTTTRDVTPNKSTITLAAAPSGMQLLLDGQPKTTPYSFVGVVGMERTLQAPSPQSLSFQTYQFRSWSDGGGANHTISTPSSNTTYAANYDLSPTTGRYNMSIASVDLSNNALTGYYVTIQSGGSTVATGFTPMIFSGNASTTYTVTPHDYSSVSFDHWDDGSMMRARSITLNSDLAMTAYYRTPTSQPTLTLTVGSQDTNGNIISGYWAVLYGSTGNPIASGFTPATFTLNSGQQYSIGVGNYSAYSFLKWADNGSTANPRGLSITTNTQLTAIYSTGEIVHMDNRVVSWGSLTYAGRQVNAEYVWPASQLVGKNIDSITLQLMKRGSPMGVAQVGVFNEDLTVKKLFANVTVSSLANTYQDYEFRLSGGELYTIQSGDRIGIKYSAGDSNNGILIMIDRDTTSSFDGVNSQRIRYESGGWLYYDTGEDMYMVLKQTHL